MTEPIQIRTVAVEFLRAGPPHNQLLSPLTQYLAVCGDAGAGVVTVPYEQAAFERKLKELRYETGDTDDRLAMLHDVGVEMGRILGSVPGLPCALTVDPSKAATLIHLRLTLSASELAHLPFELAKVPVGPTMTSESWLAIQTRPPVCVTRNIRTVSPEGVVWPHKPRILFISGAKQFVPFDEHREALEAVIDPFRDPKCKAVKSDGREEIGDLLTILENPSLAEVLEECSRTAYTHVHILTHGDADDTAPGSYGLVLRGVNDSADVISGDRFANALVSVSSECVHRPSVVTVASCDSGNVGTVATPGASFAHALHQAGIPLVVASQFPLSMEGSVPLVGKLYDALLWGEHPLLALRRVRAELHARFTANWHDWASLVVYEALPRALDDQLDSLRYHQARRAMDAALERIDRAVAKKSQESLPVLDRAVESALNRLPYEGQYAVECLGLRGSARKRMAQAAFTLHADAPVKRREWRDPHDLLEEALTYYNEAVRRLLVNDGKTVQRVATLHWVLVQAVSLSAVLGKQSEEERWKAAKLCAELYVDHAEREERAWAHASLAELYLLQLAESKSDAWPHVASSAEKEAGYLVTLYPSRMDFPVKSTVRQLRRYVDWWGKQRIAALSESDPASAASWKALVDAANGLVALLDRPDAAPEDSGPSTPSGGAGGHGTPSPTPGAAVTEAPAPRAALGAATHRRTARPVKAASPQPPAVSRHEGPFFDIEMFPAGHGDALWIEYGDANVCHRVLVDCGTQQTAPGLLRRVEQLPSNARRLELFVMTHIDADHIGGALRFLQAVKEGLRIDDTWFNGWRHISGSLGARQGEVFSSALQDLELRWNDWRGGDAIVVGAKELPVCQLPGGMKLTLLSPQPAELRKLAPVWTRELKRFGLEPGSRIDYSRFLRGTPSTSTDVDSLADEAFSGDAAAPNGSSIALLAEYGNAAVLLGADAYAPVLATSIKQLLQARGGERLKLDAFKVPHHGSQNNLSNDLLDLVACPRYLLSTNGDHFYHPDRQAVARIIKHGGERPSLYFNYRTHYNEVWGEAVLQEQYAYTAHFPADAAGGSVVSLLAPRL